MQLDQTSLGDLGLEIYIFSFSSKRVPMFTLMGLLRQLMSLSASQAASLLLLGLLSSSASGWCSRVRLKQDCLLRSRGWASLTPEAVRELDLGLEDTWRHRERDMREMLIT